MRLSKSKTFSRVFIVGAGFALAFFLVEGGQVPAAEKDHEALLWSLAAMHPRPALCVHTFGLSDPGSPDMSSSATISMDRSIASVSQSPGSGPLNSTGNWAVRSPEGKLCLGNDLTRLEYAVMNRSNVEEK
jgi:hypothetical protein